jgi:TolB-like protein/Tfp pilus assembly protein PilF
LTVPLKLNILGRFEARLPSGEIVSLPTRKTETLLAYLALVPGPHSRDHLTNLLWSDRGEQQARNSLRQALNALKKLFNDIEPQPLLIERMNVNLANQSLEIDALKLEELIQDQTPQTAAQATKLYRGEFLEGVAVRDSNGEEWLAAERERFRRLATHVLENALAFQLGSGELNAALETGEKLVGLDRLNESAWQRLMRVYAARGERNQALMAYKRCLDILEKELGVEPTPETTALRAEIKGETPNMEARFTPTGSYNLADVVSTPAVAAGLPIPEGSDKPSIVVLPFENLGNESDTDYFADGLTRDININLCRYHELTIIESHSAFEYREAHANTKDFAQQLGVQYLASGSVRQADNRIRISAQLIEAATGKMIWADSLERAYDDVFTLEDEISAKIASNLINRIEVESIASAARKPPNSMNAFECVLQARQYKDSFDQDEIATARKLLARAIELDPMYATAYGCLAHTYVKESETDWCVSRLDTLEQAIELSRKAIALDDFDSFAHMTIGWAYMNQEKFDLAKAHLDRAIDCNPNEYDAYCTKCWLLAFSGGAAEATMCGTRALQLNPLAPDECLKGIAIARYTDSEYASALEMLERIEAPDDQSEAIRAACLAQLGQDTEARRAANRVIEMGGEFIQHQGWLNIWTFKYSRDLEHFIDGLHKSGVLR